MSTNYYLYKKLSAEDKQKAIDYINNDNYYQARKILKEEDLEIHIGKRSCGWKFLWNAHNFKYYEPNAESLKAWLQSGIIVDEYGKEYTLEKFLVEEVIICSGEAYIDLEQYYRIHKDEIPHKFNLGDIDSYTRKYKVNPNPYGEFYIPGGSLCSFPLRFTMHTDFC